MNISNKEFMQVIWIVIIVLLNVGLISKFITDIEYEGFNKKSLIEIIIFVIEFIIFTYFCWFK